MLFDFRSQKEKEEEAINFREQMYPLGKQQVLWEEQVFNKIFANRKGNIPLLRYSAINHRQQALIGNTEDKEWHKAIKIMHISKEEIKAIELINKLESQATTLDDLPSIEVLEDMLKEN